MNKITVEYWETGVYQDKAGNDLATDILIDMFHDSHAEGTSAMMTDEPNSGLKLYSWIFDWETVKNTVHYFGKRLKSYKEMGIINDYEITEATEYDEAEYSRKSVTQLRAEKPDETKDIVMKAMRHYIADMALSNADPERTRVAVDMSRYIIQAMKANKHE